MNRLVLTIKRPGSLLSKLLEADINDQQYAQIVMLLTHPDKYAVVKRKPMGFSRPVESERPNPTVPSL